MGDYPRHCHKEFITRNYSYHCVLQGNRSNGGELIRVGVELKRLMMENVREIDLLFPRLPLKVTGNEISNTFSLLLNWIS